MNGIQVECGVGIVRALANNKFTMLDALREWIDNALDAGATEVAIEYDREARTLRVADNGAGCPDLSKMVSLAKSLRYPTTRAGMYGVGGVFAGIWASQMGRVHIDTQTAEHVGQVIVDWGEMVRRDEWHTVSSTWRPRAARAGHTGTRIFVETCRAIDQPKRLVQELSYYYSAGLKRGLKIALAMGGTATALTPYEPPKFVRGTRRTVEIAYRGMPVRVLCGLVQEGERNPYKGWSFLWAHRVIKRTGMPAGEKSDARIYGEVCLPDEWSNITTTKDGFSDEPHDLYDQIGAACRQIIDRADSEAREFELDSAAREVGELFTAIAREARGIMGRRDGDTGQEGTVEPTGNGSPHRRFSKTQPGDKAAEASPSPIARMPSRFKAEFSKNLESVYEIEQRSRLLIITLNDNNPLIASFAANAGHLAALCAGYIAHELAHGAGAEGLRPMFRFAESYQYEFILNELMQRLASKLPVEAS